MIFHKNAQFSVPPTPHTPGQWVRFVDDYAIDANDFVVAGMFGVVDEDPYSLCTPGISVMVRVPGTKHCYGFPCEVVTPVAPPSEAEQAESMATATHAWEVLQAKGAWVGYVFPKMHYSKALEELSVHVRKLPKATDTVYLVQTMKRVRKILIAFSNSPWGKEALALGAMCEPHIAPKAPPVELLQAIEAWIAGIYEDIRAAFEE